MNLKKWLGRLWWSVEFHYSRWQADRTPAKPRPWWWNQRCCDKAQQGTNCVCSFNTICPDHGERHHGTHD